MEEILVLANLFVQTSSTLPKVMWLNSVSWSFKWIGKATNTKYSINWQRNEYKCRKFIKSSHNTIENNEYLATQDGWIYMTEKISSHQPLPVGYVDQEDEHPSFLQKTSYSFELNHIQISIKLNSNYGLKSEVRFSIMELMIFWPSIHLIFIRKCRNLI